MATDTQGHPKEMKSNIPQVRIPIDARRPNEPARVEALIRAAVVKYGECQLRFIVPQESEFSVIDAAVVEALTPNVLLELRRGDTYIPSSLQLLMAMELSTVLKHGWANQESITALLPVRYHLRLSLHVGLIEAIVQAGGYKQTSAPKVERTSSGILLTGETDSGRVCWSVSYDGRIELRVTRGTEVKGDKITVLILQLEARMEGDDVVVDPAFSVYRHNPAVEIGTRHLEAVSPLVAAMLRFSTRDRSRRIDSDHALGRIANLLPESEETERLRREIWATA